MNKQTKIQNLKKYIIKNIIKTDKIIYNEITLFGGNLFYLFFSCFFLFMGENQIFLRLILGYLIFTIIGIIIRLIYFKNRPNNKKYNNLIEKILSSSFPSMHSTRVFYLFIIMINFFKDFEVKIFLIITLILVLYSRIYLKKHDLEDVFYGCVLAGFVYWLIVFF